MPLISIGIAWLVGIYLAAQVNLLPLVMLPLVALSIGLAVAFRRSPRQRWAALCAMAALLGALRYSIAQPSFDERSLATYNNRTQIATLVGMVDSEPDARDTYIRLRVQAETVAFGKGPARAVNGLALVRAPRYPEYHYGDRLSITGQLESPPVLDDFDYRAYLARQGVYSQITRPQIESLSSGNGLAPYAWLLAFKERVKLVIAQILPEPQASLLTGILLGIESGIPANVQEAFRITGTSHVIAISGFNMTLLAGLLSAVATRLFGKRYDFYIIVTGLFIYTVLVGASASVVRAAVMSSLYVWAMRLGRQSAALNSLFAASIMMTLLDPHTLWDMGFVLSFSATLGLILYTDRIQQFFERLLLRALPAERARRVLGLLNDALIVTLAAQVTTLPIIIYVFRQLSIVSLLTNLLILPAQPFVMIWGGLATIAGLIWIPFGQILGWIAWLFLAWTIGMIELTSRLPGASISLGNIHVAWIVGYYAALGGLTWWGWLPLERRAELRAALAHRLAGKVRLQHALAGMAIAAVLAALALVKLPDGKLHVDFIEVGQADAVFIQTPAGRSVLVDAGGSASTTLDQLGRRLPFWDHSLDVAVIARTDDAHLAAWTAVLERYPAGIVVAPPVLSGGDLQIAPTTPTELRLSQVIAGQRAQLVPAAAGTSLQLDQGVKMEIVGAPAQSCQGADPLQGCQASLSVSLVLGNVSFLLAGENAPPGGWPAGTVLRLARQGSEQANPPGLLAAVNPTVVIVSVDANNRFGLPSPMVLSKLSGRTIFRTDQHGSIHISTDGLQLWAQPER